MSTPGYVVQEETVRRPPKLPLVNRFSNRGTSVPILKDARLINCWAEFDPEERGYQVNKRPGIAPAPSYSSNSSPFFSGCGMYTHAATGALIFGFRRSFGVGTGVQLFSSLSASGTVPIDTGTVTQTDNGRPLGLSFETVNSSPQTVVVDGGGSAAIINTSTWAVTLIADATFNGLSRVPGLVYLDRTLYVMDVFGNIYGTANPDNAAVWSALNVIRANSNADLGVALAKQLSYVVALKQYTTEIFYNAGNATGSPLSRLPDSQIPLGCYSALSVKNIDNSLFWMTANDTASPKIVQMDNITPKIVSTPAVERILQNYSAIGGFLVAGVFIQYSGAFAWVLKLSGHRFYGLTLVNLNITLVYDIDQELWYIWNNGDASFYGGLWPVYAMSYTPPGGTPPGNPAFHFVQTTGPLSVGDVRPNSAIYKLDADDVYPFDIDKLIPVDIYTPNIDMQTIRAKMWSSIYLCGDRVTGSLIQVRWSDDDYTTWTNYRPVDLGLKKPILTGLGTSSHRRAFNFHHESATKFRIRYVAPNVDIGAL